MTSRPEAEPSLAGQEIPGADETYGLTLFVSGATELSAGAISAARYRCDTNQAGRHRLCVIDIRDASVDSRVLAAPTLVKDQPLPARRIVGDLSNIDRVLAVLEISAAQIAIRNSD
jgi:circadian clock protein KaiB